MHQWDVSLRPDSYYLAHALRGLAAEASDDVRALLDGETADQTA